MEIRYNEKRFVLLKRSITAVIWLAFIIFGFINRDKITVEVIAEYAPENLITAAVLMLLLFAFKSVAFFIYGGILYVASGIIFPLPAAIIVNMAGTIIMTTIPFFIGGKAGRGILNRLIEKYPKLGMFKELQNKNEFFVSLIVRIVGCLPADLVGMYLGACGMRYSRYITGTMLGLFPSVVVFTVMGMSADDVTSPEFIISVTVEILLLIISALIYYIKYPKHKKGAKNDI